MAAARNFYKACSAVKAAFCAPDIGKAARRDNRLRHYPHYARNAYQDDQAHAEMKDRLQNPKSRNDPCRFPYHGVILSLSAGSASLVFEHLLSPHKPAPPSRQQER